MKILVVSDSHGKCEYMLRAIRLENPDYLIHLGDHSLDAQCLKSTYPALPILSIRGNCDCTDTQTPDIAEPVYAGIRFFATHGHRYGVKNGLLRILMAAKEKAARIVLFGHTHCAYCEEHSGVWMLNPGSCGQGINATYGLIVIKDELLVCSVKRIEEGDR